MKRSLVRVGCLDAAASGEADRRAVGRRAVRACRLPSCPSSNRRIGEFYGDPRKRFFAELIIDIEEDPFTRVVSVGMLRERER